MTKPIVSKDFNLEDIRKIRESIIILRSWNSWDRRIVNDMDELEEALSKKDITQEQFNLAIETNHRLQQGLLSEIVSFTEYTGKCCEMIKKL